MRERVKWANPRSRGRLEEQGLRIEYVDLDAEYPHCRVIAPSGAELLYWPTQDAWRSADGKQRGKGIVTLIRALKPGAD